MSTWKSASWPRSPKWTVSMFKTWEKKALNILPENNQSYNTCFKLQMNLCTSLSEEGFWHVFTPFLNGGRGNYLGLGTTYAPRAQTGIRQQRITEKPPCSEGWPRYGRASTSCVPVLGPCEQETRPAVPWGKTLSCQPFLPWQYKISKLGHLSGLSCHGLTLKSGNFFPLHHQEVDG